MDQFFPMSDILDASKLPWKNTIFRCFTSPSLNLSKCMYPFLQIKCQYNGFVSNVIYLHDCKARTLAYMYIYHYVKRLLHFVLFVYWLCFQSECALGLTYHLNDLENAVVFINMHNAMCNFDFTILQASFCWLVVKNICIRNIFSRQSYLIILNTIDMFYLSINTFGICIYKSSLWKYFMSITCTITAWIECFRFLLRTSSVTQNSLVYRNWTRKFNILDVFLQRPVTSRSK